MRSEAVVIGSLLSLSFAASSFGAAWSPPAGSADSFTYANGQDVQDRFGSPVVNDDRFVFFPSRFEATAPGGTSSASDTLSVDLFANPDRQFTQVVATVSGTYAVEQGVAEVSFDGQLLVDAGSGPVAVPVTFIPASPITEGEGLVTGSASFLVPPAVTELTVSFSTTLNAQSTSGATSVIALLNTQVALSSVPEPATLGSLAMAAGMLLRRRR